MSDGWRSATGRQRSTFSVTAIGVIHRPGMNDGEATAEGAYFDPFAESIVEIHPEWADGLIGIEEFSHLVVVLYMDRARPLHHDEPLVHRVESRDGMPAPGLFSTRSPRRPNPLGLCYPRLLKRAGNMLHVKGLDGWPGTPVLDLKGYYVRDELQPDATAPDWLRRLWSEHDLVRGADHRPSTGEAGC